MGAAREVWRRACRVHLRAKPTIHWHWALFEDRHAAVLSLAQEEGPHTSALEILASLEDRLPDSALVCGRRADAMRRDGQPVCFVRARVCVCYKMIKILAYAPSYV